MLTCEYCVKLKACSAKTIAKDCEKNPEYEGERFCPDFKKVLTNVDHIRAMSDEELAEFLNRVKEPCDCCHLMDTEGACTETLCDDAMKSWLKQPYKENEE